MYHWIVRRRARRVFDLLTVGEWEPVLADCSEDVHHVFPGDHPLGGVRHTRAGVARWFERLGFLFPSHKFEVDRVVSRGWPWSTWIAVRWTALLKPRAGDPYTNEGTHWIHLRWGKVVYFHAYLDTQAVAEACASMAREGIAEASADPIRDAPLSPA